VRLAVGTAAVRHTEFAAARLQSVFAQCFLDDFNTRLQGEFLEPVYQPSTTQGIPHCIGYRHDYFASALHEVAHWCIAGSERRSQVDYGYWYAPDGRDEAAQDAFEAVECKPQALEWVFSRASGFSFRISVDNLDSGSGEIPDSSRFKARVLAQLLRWQQTGLPVRAQTFFQALSREFGDGAVAVKSMAFELEELS
jgi:elongation factor P hydroxylase